MIGLIIPPGEIKKLLEKTAEHVAHNGSEFEKILIQREQHKPEFAFLKPQSPYRAYYDHKVAEVSKKLLQGIMDEEPQQPEPTPQVQTAIPEPIVVEQEDPNRQQARFLEQIFVELKEPDPEKYVAELPEKLSEGEQAIIQHTAQYVARNGKNFLVALSEREKNNPQYEFLRSTSKNNAYFLAVVGAYTAILEMTSEEMERWASYARGEGIMERCKEVFDFHSAKQQQARGKKQQAAKQAKESNIDWNDFELVETISFQVDHNKNLSGSELLNKIQQHAPPIPKTMEERIISEPRKREILQQCHVCRQNILASEMNRHLKTCLGAKKKGGQQETQSGQDVDIRRNLESLSTKRPDIFGAQENQITLQEERQEERVIFDGQAPNLTRTTGGIAMLNYQQKKLREEMERTK